MNRGLRGRTALRWVGGALLLFLYAPIVTIVLLSFSGDRHGQGLQGWTLGWYEALSANEPAKSALWQSVKLAVVSSLVATVLGTLVALGMRGRGKQSWWGRGVEMFVQLPLMIPDVVMAVSFLVLAQMVRKWAGWFELGFGTMVVGHVTLQIPFVAMVVAARREGLDPALEEAARDLGASPWQTLWSVTLPLLMPGIWGGALLAFALSLDDFVISFFTSGPGTTTLPVWIHSSVRRGLSPEVHALSTLLIVAAVVLTVVAGRSQRGAALSRGWKEEKDAGSGAGCREM